MSIDARLTYSCPHLTVEEVAEVVDRQILKTRQPVASSKLVRVLINDTFEVLPDGSYSQARLISRTGPYYIVKNEQELVVAGSTETVTLTLPATEETGQSLTTDELVSLLRPLATALHFENSSGALLIQDTANIGAESSLRLSGSAVENLFPHQTGDRGRQLWPGWDIWTPPGMITSKYIRFRFPIRSNPKITVTYPVRRTRCLRCRAGEIENDPRFTEDGNLILIENENLLNQLVLKSLLTDKGSNPYFKGYGTLLRSRIGKKATTGIAASITQDVKTCLEKVKQWQEAQSGYQYVSRKERLAEIVSVDTYPHKDDPTTFMVDVVVRNASRTPIRISVVYTVPGVVARLVSDGIPLAQVGDTGGTLVALADLNPRRGAY